MSEGDKEQKASDDASFDEQEALPAASEQAGDDASTVEETEPSANRNSKTGRGLSLIAILLSVVAIAAAGLVGIMEFRAGTTADDAAESLSRLSARVDESRETLRSLSDRIAEQADVDATIRERLGEAEDTLSSPTELLGSLPSRVSSLERNVAGLQGVSSGSRDFWLLAEAEYFLQIANAQAELAGNPTLAAAALRQADERLTELSSPAYTDVRGAIADEVAKLELMTSVDVAGLTLTLASLSRVVDSLPVRQREEDEDGEAPADTADEQSGLDRAWSSVKEAMSGLVKVTKPGGEGSPLLTPDAAVLLRANLSLQLQAARLALLKGERAIFEQSLVDAEDWLMTYFDITSVQVTSALETITEIRNSPAMDDVPDISRSLELLRQTRMLQENAE